MNDDDHGLHGASSDMVSAPPGERERAIREVIERIAAAAAAQRAAPKDPDVRPREAPPPTSAGEGATLRSPPAWVAWPVGLVSSHPPDAQTLGPAGAAPSFAPVPGPAPPASLPPVVRAPAFLTTTAPLPDLSPEALAKGGALPFHPAPAAQPPQRRAAPRTVQSRVMDLGGTMPLGDDSIEKAMAAARSLVPLPPLTLRQFASLCAELTFQPERRSEILARYQVDGEAVYTALDAYWRRERAARPEARTAFADDFASHLAWLHTHRPWPLRRSSA